MEGLNSSSSAGSGPSDLPRVSTDTKQPIKARVTLLMGIRCNTCARFFREGNEFMSRPGEMMSRYCFDCPDCSAEIVIKTDPENSSLVMESGATPIPEDEGVDVAKIRLENDVDDAKREVDVFATLEWLYSIRPHPSVTIAEIFDALRSVSPDGTWYCKGPKSVNRISAPSPFWGAPADGIAPLGSMKPHPGATLAETFASLPKPSPHRKGREACQDFTSTSKDGPTAAVFGHGSSSKVEGTKSVTGSSTLEVSAPAPISGASAQVQVADNDVAPLGEIQSSKPRLSVRAAEMLAALPKPKRR